MQFSKMTSRITLEFMTETKDSDSGELVLSVSRSLKVWAEIKPVSGAFGTSQQSAAGGSATLGAQAFIVRYRSDIASETWRIKDYAGDYWDIIDIPRFLGNKSALELNCQRTGKSG